jgi:hypothetical protein
MAALAVVLECYVNFTNSIAINKHWNMSISINLQIEP